MKNQLPENTNQFTPADIAAIDAKLDELIIAIEPVVSKIAPGPKRRYPVGGPKKEETMRMAQQIKNVHPEIFPVGYNTDKIDIFMKNRSDMYHFKIKLMQLYIKCNDTFGVNSILASNETNYIYKMLKLAANRDPALRTLQKKMGKYFERDKRIPPAEHHIGGGVSIELNNAIPGRLVTNTGNSALILTAGSQLAPTVTRVDNLIFEPGNSAKIPPRYTSVCVTNRANTDGSFTIKLKH